MFPPSSLAPPTEFGAGARTGDGGKEEVVDVTEAAAAAAVGPVLKSLSSWDPAMQMRFAC
eukprot:evm.model.NODE_5196_length_11394_cov_36.544411.2